MTLDKRELNFSIFDNSPAAYAVVEVLLNDNNKPYDWIYRYCNNAFADIKGYRRNAIIDHTSLSLFTSVDEKYLQAYYGAAYKNKSFNIVLENKYDAAIMPTGNAGLCSIMINVKNDDKSEKAYDAEDEQNYVINKLSADYVSLYNINLNTGKYEILRLNSNTNAKKIAGEGDSLHIYDTFDEFVKIYADTFISAQDREEFVAWLLCSNMKELLTHNEKITFHYKSISKEGRLSYYEACAVKGKITKAAFNIFLGFRNIDSILYKEKEIQKKLEIALAQTRLGNEIINAIAKTYQYISRIDINANYFEEISNNDNMYYLKSGEMYESNKQVCERCIAEEYREAYLKFSDITTLASRMQNDETISMEYKMIDGSWHKLRFIEKKRDKNGNLTHVICAIRSISDTKRREQRLLYEVDEARKDAAYKTRFLSNMSHDIRTPINGIVGMIDLAESAPQNLDMQEKCREKIKNSAKYLVALVDDILAMSKLEAEECNEQKIAFNLAEVLNHSNTEKQMEAAEKNVEYIVDWENSELNHMHLYGNPVYLERVLIIIANNAIKFTNPGDHICVSCKETYADDKKVVYEFVCSDTGIGMNEEFISHAFDMFSQENESSRTKFEGSGLGLAIAKKMIDRMNGTIRIESKKNFGTTVTVTIPFDIANSDEIIGIVDCDSISVEGMHAMLVEDNELNMEIAKLMLENNGIHVDSVVNGEEAVEAFRNSELNYYDVIFMDIMMPCLNGWDAARLIRTMKRADSESVPIIAMSANAFAEDVINSRISGMNEHLTKPIDERKMIQAIKKYHVSKH